MAEDIIYIYITRWKEYNQRNFIEMPFEWNDHFQCYVIWSEVMVRK